MLDDDFKRIPISDQRQIFRSIEKKLAVAPESFGKPLGAELKGYYRLRVGYYRVIYSIKKTEVTVFVVKVGLRKDLLAYIQAAKRLKLMK
ncbi:type II toxin-antitoxin system RelE/ParE family toxin [Candidatus Peregrinibacteria bacterium]|nr:type II toxin-antitoxin system RelE/ParE family toxin [Candidatus Peregrinibacteria bacterium]